MLYFGKAQQFLYTMLRVIRRIICVFLLAVLVCSMSSCGSVEGLLRYVLSLPTHLLNAVKP